MATDAQLAANIAEYWQSQGYRPPSLYIVKVQKPRTMHRDKTLTGIRSNMVDGVPPIIIRKDN